MESRKAGKHSTERHSNEMLRINKCVLSVCKEFGWVIDGFDNWRVGFGFGLDLDLSWSLNVTEMAETHVELNQFPIPRVGPRHSTLMITLQFLTSILPYLGNDTRYADSYHVTLIGSHIDYLSNRAIAKDLEWSFKLILAIKILSTANLENTARIGLHVVVYDLWNKLQPTKFMRKILFLLSCSNDGLTEGAQRVDPVCHRTQCVLLYDFIDLGYMALLYCLRSSIVCML